MWWGVSKLSAEMNCNFCEQPATVFYTQVVQGQMKKICLCEDCAEAKGITNPDAFSMADVLMDDQPQQANAVPILGSESCDKCGFTLEDLRKVGRLGCSACYQAFQAEILPMLEKMHKGVSHCGKVPEGLVDTLVKRQQLAKLRAQLEKAISDEDFEAAAEHRDSIKELESK